jgi:hypothetical protein
MPSDTHVEKALEVIADARESFLAAVRMAADQISAQVRSHDTPASEARDQVAAELGAFAEGLIDASRFPAQVGESNTLDDTSADLLRRAGEALDGLSSAKPEDFVLTVSEGGDVCAAVEKALARLGRAFGAAELAKQARVGGGGTDAALDRLSSYPAAEWRVRERELAPPLVVSTPGGGLDLAGLRNLLEGSQILVLLAEGPCPPAPLASLLSPGVFLLQTTNPDELAGLGDLEGPAVIALLPEGAAEWIHDPRGGDTLAERLTVRALPDSAGIGPLDGVSVWRQREDLRHLAAMVDAAKGGPATGAAPSANGLPGEEPVEPVDLLAAWLIRQADLPATD